MNRKYIGLLIILLGLIAMVAFIYFSFFYEPSQKEVVQQPVAQEQKQNTSSKTQINTPAITDSQEKAVISAKPQTIINKEDVTEEDLKRMAGSFAERFGSYSNQSDYGNIRDLELFMSDNMKRWAEKFIADSIAQQNKTDIYYGITTRAVSKTVQQFDENGGSAKILVRTQRRESTGTTANAINFYQDVLVSFVKEKGAWKVDSAYWQKK